MVEAQQFQAAVKQNVEHALSNGCDPFLVMSILDTAKLDIYFRLRAAASKTIDRKQIVQANCLPPNGINGL